MVSVTLAEIRRSADGTYPKGLLDACDTALVLFAAGFYGRQDGIFIADAGITATCVDIRPQRLRDMAAVYPGSWEFFVDDAYEFAALTERRWDLVSIDCPSGAFVRCAELVGLWCSLARVAVVLGTGKGTVVEPPEGWRVTDVIQRSQFSGGVYWSVLEPL